MPSMMFALLQPPTPPPKHRPPRQPNFEMAPPSPNPEKPSTSPSAVAAIQSKSSPIASPTRSTRARAISPFPPGAAWPVLPRRVAMPVVKPFKNGQCTHLTMTRMYTTEYVCHICTKVSPTSWLFRCTQDRELILEDDLERGQAQKFDQMSDHFPIPSRRPRGPAARSSKLSFLEEVADEHLDTYTASQIGKIIEQRTHVREVAIAQSLSLQPKPPSPPTVSKAPDSPTKSPQKKPWLPLPGGECQFKVCPHCRPSARERSYLSMDGIANGDIPASLLTGFGFHVQGSRPVSKVEHVKNLGLREPLAREKTQPVTEVDVFERMEIALGIGAGNGKVVVPRPLPQLPVKKSDAAGFAALPLSPLTNRASKSAGKNNVDNADATVAPAADADRQKQPVNLRSPKRTAFVPLADLIAQSRAESRVAAAVENTKPATTEPVTVPVPISVTGPPTPMEERELKDGFGAAPLKVPEGIAVTEEAVGLHVADLITQL